MSKPHYTKPYKPYPDDSILPSEFDYHKSDGIFVDKEHSFIFNGRKFFCNSAG